MSCQVIRCTAYLLRLHDGSTDGISLSLTVRGCFPVRSNSEVMGLATMDFRGCARFVQVSAIERTFGVQGTVVHAASFNVYPPGFDHS